MVPRNHQFDFDFIVIGSGFGGSVSALRLAEKGYKVAVMEMGRRWTPDNLPRTSWSIHRWLWRPKLGLRGFFNMRFFRHATIFHGCAVGGWIYHICQHPASASWPRVLNLGKVNLMNVYWFEQKKADVPAANDWLSANEAAFGRAWVAWALLGAVSLRPEYGPRFRAAHTSLSMTVLLLASLSGSGPHRSLLGMRRRLLHTAY